MYSGGKYKSPEMIIDTGLEFNQILLIVLCVMAYIGNMAEQIRNKNVDITYYDWLFYGWTGIIGGVVAYYTALAWLNIGLRFSLTIIVSMAAPRIFRFIGSPSYQEMVAEGIGKGLINLIKSMFNGNGPTVDNQRSRSNRDNYDRES